MEKRRHPFEAIEEHLQLTLSVLSGDADGTSNAATWAIQTVRFALIDWGYRFFAKPRLNSVECDADDAASNWFLRVNELIQAGYPFRRPFYPFALVLLRNICRGMARRARVRKTLPLDPDLASGSVPPDEVAFLGELQQQVLLAVESLCDEERKVVLGRYWRGMSLPDLARQLRTSPVCVKRLLECAKKRLRGVLAELKPTDFR